MIKRVISYIVAFLSILWGGCHSSQTVTQSSPSPTHVKPPAAVVDNVTRIEAVIDKKDLTDSVHFSLTLFIVSSSPVTGRVSLIEAQQKVTVSAKYFMNEAGGVDLTNERNKSLFAVRTKNVGETIKGTISRDQWGGYNLLTVEAN